MLERVISGGQTGARLERPDRRLLESWATFEIFS
jgi:hypothetical protein